MSENDEHSSETESLGMEWGTTSEEEDMPPELEEEEGGDKDEDSTEADDEREEGVDMVAESCKRRGHKTENSADRVWPTLKVRLMQALSKETWLSQVQAYKTWFYNQCRSGANHSWIKVGRSCTSRAIIQETHKMAINKVIRKQYGKKAGTKEALSVYQKARKNGRRQKILPHNGISIVDLQITSRQARYGQKVFCEFAQEMWWACGMRVVIMVGWTQEDGSIVTSMSVILILLMRYSGDFNDEIAHGEKFQGVQKISTAWDKYISTHFEPEGEPNTDHSDSEEESNPKQNEKQKRPNPTIQEQLVPAQKRFHHWIDENRDLQESIKGLSEADCGNEDRIEAHGSTSSTEQPTRKKGKGKEKEKGKVPTENAVGVQDTTKVNFILGAKKKSKSLQRSTTPQTNMAGGSAQGGGKTQPSDKAAASRSTAPNINVPPNPKPAKMPKAKSMSKQVRPIMVPVLGSEQESELDNNPLNKPASSVTHIPPPSSKPINKSNSMSKRGGTPHPTQKSTAHQTSQWSANKGSSAATSSIQADPPESDIAGVQTEDADVETLERKMLRKRKMQDSELIPVKRQKQ
ncbi:hypothetical protein BS17DRAFT_767557 [Gyrodon lividus]|nr:hypothetical protein BS17DRAFT_767557 [Gyrodon lividus]